MNDSGGLRDCGNHSFYANAIPAYTCGDEWQIRNRDLKCMGASGTPMCDLADREPLTAPEAYSFSAITNYLLFTSVSETCLYPVLCSVTIKVHQTASTLECKIWGKFMSLGHGHSVGSRINSPLSSLSQGSCFCVDSGSSAFSMTGLQGLIKDILYNAIKYVFYVRLQLPP